jgi:hypothetical protein
MSKRKPPTDDAVSRAASAMIRKRYAKMTKDERVRLASKAGSASWDGMTEEQRSEEMKRRILKRRRSPRR